MTTWDERFAAPGWAYGTEPTPFLRDQRHHLAAGAKALAVADGEGRHAVFMAEHGLAVTAMDASPVAVAKARGLAEARGVAVTFQVADVTAWTWEPDTYDLVLATFIQFLAPEPRRAVFAGLVRTLKPGGVLLLHGYRPEQVDYGTGGPPHRDQLYTAADLRAAFAGMEILRLAAYDRELQEGRLHHGMSALIDLVARKPRRDERGDQPTRSRQRSR
jgi:SAM-dependent methyltransferase